MISKGTFVLFGLLTSLAMLGAPFLYSSVQAEQIAASPTLSPAQYYGGGYGVECIDPYTGYPCSPPGY